MASRVLPFTVVTSTETDHAITSLVIGHVCAVHRNVRRILVMGINAPLPPEAKFFFENLTTKWFVLKYIRINMWSA